MPALSSHEGGGGWPGGLGGIPPGLFGGGASLFGDGTYSQNVIQGGSTLQPVDGVLTITAAATVAPDGTTGASVVMCDCLVIDGASASLKPSTNSKGLIVFAKTGVYTVNGGTISGTALGKAGAFGNLPLWDLIPTGLQRKLKKDALAAFVLVGEGAAGGAGSSTTGEYGTGVAAASPLQSGGGGSGGTWGSTPGGNGGKGGPCSGGAGGGGNSYTGGAGGNAGDYGGPGGNAKTGNAGNVNNGGGAGDPIGTNTDTPCGSVSPPPGAGGCPVFLIAPVVSVAAGTIVQSDGSRGADCVGVGGGYSMAGGGAGGGPVGIITEAGGYTNSGTVRANGGAGGSSSGASGNYNGGPGGVGSVNTYTI